MLSVARTSLRRALARAASSPAAAVALETGARAPFSGFGALTGAASAAERRSAVAAVAAATRGFRASAFAAEADAAPADGKGLSQVLGEELEHERTTYTPSEVVSRGPPQPFEIIESDGDCEVTLIRTYGEDEEIAITFNATEVRRATRPASASDPTRARPPSPRDRIRRRDADPPFLRQP